jgi:hypothetical protein
LLWMMALLWPLLEGQVNRGLRAVPEYVAHGLRLVSTDGGSLSFKRALAPVPVGDWSAAAWRRSLSSPASFSGCGSWSTSCVGQIAGPGRTESPALSLAPRRPPPQSGPPRPGTLLAGLLVDPADARRPRHTVPGRTLPRRSRTFLPRRAESRLAWRRGQVVQCAAWWSAEPPWSSPASWGLAQRSPVQVTAVMLIVAAAWSLSLRGDPRSRSGWIAGCLAH